MPDDLTPTIDPDDDEALSDALADKWVELALTDPAILKAARRAAGLIKCPAEMTLEELAREQGADRHTLQRIARKAIQRLRYAPQISAYKPEA